MNIKNLSFLLAVITVLASCDINEGPRRGGPNNGNVEDEISALPMTQDYPADNPYSVEKTNLGKMLFWDPIMSGKKDIACVSCHHPDFGYADGIDLPLGVGGVGLGINRTGGTLVKRNAPTIINTGFNGIDNDGNYSHSDAPMFWDNRVKSLELQAIHPMLSKEEMRGELISETAIIDTLINRLNNIPQYKSLFTAAFGSEGITEDRIGKAIATFERTIMANNSRFDQYMRGDDNALSNQEIDGMNRFVAIGCADCHGGAMFSDYELHTIGVPNHNLVTDEGATGDFDFRTPTLRNLTFTAPYMHNGRFETLRDVLEFYDDASDGRENRINNQLDAQDLDNDIRNLNLRDNDHDEIIAFLRALSDDSFDKTVPESVPSKLPVGGNIQ
ncbi:MAG: cytochrome-c peroxidase [Saprospiraceae bacterium]